MLCFKFHVIIKLDFDKSYVGANQHTLLFSYAYMNIRVIFPNSLCIIPFAIRSFWNLTTFFRFRLYNLWDKVNMGSSSFKSQNNDCYIFTEETFPSIIVSGDTLLYEEKHCYHYSMLKCLYFQKRDQFTYL